MVPTARPAQAWLLFQTTLSPGKRAADLIEKVQMLSCWQPKKCQRARLKTSKYLRGVNRRLAQAKPLVAAPEHVAEQALQHTRVEHTLVQRLALALRWVRCLLHHSWLQSPLQQYR